MSARGHLERTPVTSRDGRAANNGPGGGNTVRTVDAPWVELLLALHCQVRNALAKAGRGSTGATNPKGDEVKVFDLAANDAAVACLKAAAVPLIVQSEEAEPLEIGRDRPRYRLILDPVDGSDNRARGLPLSALSCAVLPVDAPLHPDWVEAALVGPLEEETPLIALRGSGAWRGNDRLESSDVRGIAEAMISVELNHFFSPPGFARMMAAARLVKLRATGATLSKLPFDEAVYLRNVLRRSRRQKTTIGRLHKENARLRRTVKVAKTGRVASEARLAKLRMARKTLSASLSGMDAELRRVLRRSRRQKATIKSLSRDNARLRKGAKRSSNRIETLEADLARLRATGAVLSRALYGRKSEQQEKARSGRPRGQQHGAPGHGRTQRPGLEERSEELNPPEDACVCGRCEQPYAPNGAEESTLVEIEVKAHKRVIRRPRWRRTCKCSSSPMEVSAPPVPRLFPRTLYGTSFWARFLFEHCACFRPVHRVAAWFSSQGLTVSPGTLADSLKRFVPLFEPVAHAILAHQNKAALRHADETGWRVQELRGEERSSRAWLWTSVSSDAVCFHIDPSRSAEAAHKLFGKALLGTVIVCDRYSAYKRLARLLGGLVTLAWCWSHMRRDFIDCAAGQVDLTDWCRGWIERIAGIYRLNEARLEHYDPGLKRPAPAFDAAQTALKEVLDALFAEAQRELAALPDEAREGKALRSLLNHRGGLSVFFDRPQVPMDNNKAERFLRGPSIGRRLSFGSDSEDGARFTAIMYSVVGTLSMNGIDVLRWLEAWLEACAKNGGQPPDDLSPWLPWSMSEERRRDFTAPG